jgi:hypothetical protein
VGPTARSGSDGGVKVDQRIRSLRGRRQLRRGSAGFGRGVAGPRYAWQRRGERAAGVRCGARERGGRQSSSLRSGGAWTSSRRAALPSAPRRIASSDPRGWKSHVLQRVAATPMRTWITPLGVPAFHISLPSRIRFRSFLGCLPRGRPALCCFAPNRAAARPDALRGPRAQAAHAAPPRTSRRPGTKTRSHPRERAPRSRSPAPPPRSRRGRARACGTRRVGLALALQRRTPATRRARAHRESPKPSPDRSSASIRDRSSVVRLPPIRAQLDSHRPFRIHE